MKIVNRKKFIRMIILMIGIILATSFYCCNTSFSKEERKIKTIYVSSGDTLWAIAMQEQEHNTYYQNKNIREVIYEIRKLNHLEDNANLLVGQKLIVNHK